MQSDIEKGTETERGEDLGHFRDHSAVTTKKEKYCQLDYDTPSITRCITV